MPRVHTTSGKPGLFGQSTIHVPQSGFFTATWTRQWKM